VLGASPRVEIDKASEGKLEMVSLGDHDAYLWKVDGTVDDKPVKLASFYTSWDNVTLDCGALAHPGQESLIDTFEQAMRSLRVTDGVNHPMELSWTAQYTRYWPWTHPLLQIYWLAVPLGLIAIWMAVRQK